MTTEWVDTYIGYLPIHCSCCGRRRVEGTLRTMPDGRQFVCEAMCGKCGADSDWDHPDAQPGCSPELINGVPVGYVKQAAIIFELERMLGGCECAEVRAFIPLLIDHIKAGRAQ